MDLLTEQPCVTLTIDDLVLQQCYRLRVPGITSEDGYAFLERLDSGLAATGARQLLAGATWGPIRRRYEAYDRALAEAAKLRLTSLGSNPTLAELEAVVRHASAQRTTAARLWRLPSGPDAFLAAEVRDWFEYGVGGRRFGNLMSRSMKNPRQTSWSQADHLRNIASKVGKTNAETTSGVFRSARFLKTGGAIVMIAGLGWTYHEYQNTPEPKKADFLRREAVSAAGGALAAEGIYRSIYGDSLLGQIRNTGVIQANLIRNR